MMLTITQVPYNALIIAHERMGVYAYVEILNVTLKLLIVFLLTIGDFDKLKLYAVLVLAVSMIIMMVYRVYCMRNFQESHFRFAWRKEILKPMLSFTGWDFYGNICTTTRLQGTNFLINNFFGVVANAASSIATTVNGVVEGFTGSVITAFRPGIIKNYSKQNWEEMQSLIINAIKFSSLLLIMLAIPILFETSYLMDLWLGKVPEYVVLFIRLILVMNSIAVINAIIKIGIHATGNIKRLSLYTGTIYLLSIPVSYLFLKFGFNAGFVYMVNIVSNLLILSLNLWILKKQVNKIRILPILQVIAISVIIALLSMSLIFFICKGVEVGFYRLLAITLCDIIVMPLFTYMFALNKIQRINVKNYLLGKLHFNK